MIVILRIGVHRFRKSGEREQIKPNGAVDKHLSLQVTELLHIKCFIPEFTLSENEGLFLGIRC